VFLSSIINNFAIGCGLMKMCMIVLLASHLSFLKQKKR